MDLFDPKVYNPQDLYYNNKLIPENPGVYAWYFDSHFAAYVTHNSQNAIKINFDSDPNRRWYLLYIGIAGQKEGRTLRDRIYTEHLKQNSEGSTLRQSLAALLWKVIYLDPSKQLNDEKEKMKLNNWIFRNAKVAWTETAEPEIVEKVMLCEFGHLLPLNIDDNKKNPCLKEIKQLRKLWRKGK
jgi:hypothetical protein